MLVLYPVRRLDPPREALPEPMNGDAAAEEPDERARWCDVEDVRGRLFIEGDNVALGGAPVELKDVVDDVFDSWER